MSASLPFLQALGLDHDTDERAVRRAYAQRLKLIDLDTDPHGFQQLRSHYEHALQWLAYKMQAQHEDELEPAPQSPSLVSEVEAEPVPAEIAQPREPGADELVFASFLEHVQSGFHSEDDAQRALDAALDDERLINLGARSIFEGRIAALLMNGWRPGHEFLFGPACERFDWERNARQLQAYGQLGAAINAAIHEKLIFFRQDVTHFNLQRSLIRDLRKGEPPSSTRVLVAQGPTLQMLAQRYPNWLHAIAPSDNIRNWLKLYEELPAEKRKRVPDVAQQDLAYQEPGASPKKRKWYQFQFSGGPSAWHIIWIVLMLARCANSFWPAHHASLPDVAAPTQHSFSPPPVVPPGFPKETSVPGDMASDWPGRSGSFSDVPTPSERLVLDSGTYPSDAFSVPLVADQDRLSNHMPARPAAVAASKPARKPASAP